MGDDGQHITVWVAIIGKHACWRKNDKCISGLHAVDIVTRHRRDVLHLDRQRRGRGADAVTHHVGHEFIAREACVRHVGKATVSRHGQAPVCGGTDRNHGERICVGVRVVGQQPGCRADAQGVSGMHAIGIVGPDRRRICGQHRQREAAGAGVQAVLIAQGNRNRAGTGGSVGVGYRTARSDARRRAVSPTDEVLGH